MEATQSTPHVVIVGGGFAGINAAKQLAKRCDLRITLIDRRNHHLFQPLLYQVASAGLSPADIAVPIRSIFSKNPKVSVRLDEVIAVERQAQHVVLSDEQKLNYDYLIMACGAMHSYFGHNEWETFAPGLKTLEQATEIRRRVLLSFEEAEKEKDSVRKAALQTFVVVGGGPTGVELAGALGEMSRFTLKSDFRSINPTLTRIILVEAGPRILGSFSEDLSDKATRSLEELGVNVWTGKLVTGVDARGVDLGHERIDAGCILWAAGVKPSPLNSRLGLPLDQQGRVIIQGDLSVSGNPELFVLGDQAHFSDKKSSQPLPGLAPVAIQQGLHVAQVIGADLDGHGRPEFHYNDKGQMATIGRKRAVAQTPTMKFSGFTAWMMWIFVHVYYIVGFENRIRVMMQWAWSYFTFKRGARLIVERHWKSFPEAKLKKDTRAVFPTGIERE
jgi:NADH:ubiquinone reductase (H+-translocating)